MSYFSTLIIMYDVFIQPAFLHILILLYWKFISGAAPLLHPLSGFTSQSDPCIITQLPKYTLNIS